MESVGRLHHPQPSASGPATLTARSNADGRYDRRLSRAKKRRRAGNEKLVARLAVPRHHDRHVENIRASTSLSPCVQRKIWVKIRSLRGAYWVCGVGNSALPAALFSSLPLYCGSTSIRNKSAQIPGESRHRDTGIIP